MDNWCRFQYLTKSEMWGHMEKERAGNEKTGAREVGVELEKPLHNLKT